jgi:hypothetical protein
MYNSFLLTCLNIMKYNELFSYCAPYNTWLQWSSLISYVLIFINEMPLPVSYNITCHIPISRVML